MPTKTAFQVPLSALAWEPIGPPDRPYTDLQATLQIGSVLFHVEAIEVDCGETQCAVHDSCFATFEDFSTAIEPNGRFETLRMEGREYAVFIFPYCD